MNTPLITAGALMFALSFSVIAEDMPGMKMDGVSMDGSQAAATASAEGTIKAIDGERHSVTLAHGPVAALQWPPMTMAFKTDPGQLDNLQVGDKVAFEFLYEGGASKIVNIRKK
ncbi:copper-binding protein (plasmid) [Pseudomonas nitroreducens]|uniref:Copper-binding protein n=2 Tax=Pseudomonas nitroreducens TaxID=46680 RepID=A0A6G6JA38_PSENT|nr:copper-binding protein [Pseudomonas nitroreducens]QIE91341.1 copper-binding protein [Pseudomonas nitroreducens]